MNKGTAHRAAIMAAALLAGGCARIEAPAIDYAGPTPSLDIQATGVNAPFSHFRGNLAVASVALQHAGPLAPVTSAVASGSSAGVTTVRLSATPSFFVGDVVTVTWSGTAVTLVGSSSVITRSAQYRILAGRLLVQTPPGGLAPGKSGTVCVALEPHAPTDVNVILNSTAVRVTPNRLHIAAGQSKASAVASATAGEFACPAAGSGAPEAPQPTCSAGNGVTASGTLNGIAVYGCAIVARSCCGTDGHNCPVAAAPVSLCP